MRTMRRSTSSWLSPSPKRLPTPPPMRLLARCAHMPRRRGSKYLFWARRTCRRPSLVVACMAKMSKISAVRSMTLTLPPTTFSKFDCCDGVSSSSNNTSVASKLRHNCPISSALPAPTKVRGLGLSKRCVVRATATEPAVWAKRSSSSRVCSIAHSLPGRSTPTKIARSGSSAVSTRGNRSFATGYLLTFAARGRFPLRAPGA